MRLAVLLYNDPASRHRTCMVGRTLSHYEITAKLGEGGMGEVWRAIDTALNREVAVKVLPEEMAADPERLERFKREAQAIAALNHPSIVTIYSVEEVEGLQLLTMELVEGESLDRIMPPRGFGLDQLFPLAIQIADALAAAHEKGITHRDLKPANVMVSDDTRVKLLDFGLAKLAEQGGEGDQKTQLMTEAGMILGTPHYMSPEQIESASVDPRSDVFSLGVLLYEMATGRRPFEGETPASVISSVLRDAPPTVTDLKAELPNHLGRIVRRCLEKDPSRRYQSAQEARIELEELKKEVESFGSAAEQPGRETSTPAAPGGTSRWQRAALAAIGFLGAIGAGIWAGLQLDRPVTSPDFVHLTFDRGYIHSARFAGDGQTVLYGVALADKPVRIFSTQADALGASRPLDLPGLASADVAGVSDNREAALLLDRHHVGSWLRVGTLARVDLTGRAAPREILGNVYDADISPDGKDFAVVVGDANEQRLEFPIGTVLFRTPGWISQPRISPDGERVAFLEHPIPTDDQGYVALVDADGEREAIRIDSELHDSLQGLSWSPSGEEVWYTSKDRGGELWRLTPGREPKVHLRAPGYIRIEDIDPSGRLLLIADATHSQILGRLAGDDQNRVYAWADGEVVNGVAENGSLFVGTNHTFLVDDEYLAFFRRSGDGAPVNLPRGYSVGATPDGQWVFHITRSRDRDRLTMYPTGPGQPRVLDLAGVEPASGAQQIVSSSLDGRRISFVGAERGSGKRAWMLDIATGQRHAVTPEGVVMSIISPDGSAVAVKDVRRGLWIYQVASGEGQPVEGTTMQEIPVGWSASGRGLLIWDRTFPASVERLDLESGRREVLHTLEPSDPAGILYGSLFMSTDARYYMYRYRRSLSQLYLVGGR